MLTIPCWITKTDGESLAEILRKGSSREEAAIRRQLWIHICASHHFDSSVLHCSESSQITSATACGLCLQGDHTFRARRKTLPGRILKKTRVLRILWKESKRATQGSYRTVAFSGRLFSRTSQFLQMGTDPGDMVLPYKLCSKRLRRVGGEVVARSRVARDRVDMSTGQQLTSRLLRDSFPRYLLASQISYKDGVASHCT